MGRRKTNEEFQEELRKLREQGHDVYTDDEYTGNKTMMDFYCSKGHHWPSNANRVFSGHQYCPICLNRRVLVGYNDLWTTHKEIAMLLQDPQVGYEHTYGSKYKTYFICPVCGNLIFKTIKEVCNRGLGCQRCGDTISYPNKFMRAMLSQLDVQNVDYEYSPPWLRPYLYDNYFEINDICYVLEADGGLGHGYKKFGSNEIDTTGIERDAIKDKRAQEHHVNVIRVDCCYSSDNKYEYIKQHIIDSELSRIVDLSCVDWDKCHAEALSSLVYKCADLYNAGYSIGDIKYRLGYGNWAIGSWLKQATIIGLCDYNTSESRRRGRKNFYRPVNQYTKDGVFIQTYQSLSVASAATGIDATAILNCCKRKENFYTVGGYLWFYADDLSQPDSTKNISTTRN